jgi:predicted house-cleaning noncanonical NTP pyrophosphatase (MazG superfamily)
MSDEKNIDDDYEYSRQVYYDLISKGQEGIEEMLELARASEHPRAFEVLSGMIKNVSDVSDRLMALNKTKKQIEQLNRTPALENNGGTTNNNIFIGSTTELQRFLQNEKQVIEHDDSD